MVLFSGKKTHQVAVYVHQISFSIHSLPLLPPVSPLTSWDLNIDYRVLLDLWVFLAVLHPVVHPFSWWVKEREAAQQAKNAMCVDVSIKPH